MRGTGTNEQPILRQLRAGIAVKSGQITTGTKVTQDAISDIRHEIWGYKELTGSQIEALKAELDEKYGIRPNITKAHHAELTVTFIDASGETVTYHHAVLPVYQIAASSPSSCILHIVPSRMTFASPTIHWPSWVPYR